jgi:hypothetical protein
MSLESSASLWDAISFWLIGIGAALAFVGTVAAVRARKLGRELTAEKTAIADREKAASDRAIAEANARAAEAEEKTEQERLKRVELQARVSGRQITTEGRAKIGTSLLPFSGQRIDMVSEAEPEQVVLMNQVIEIMKSAHWDFNVSTAPEWNRAVGGVLVETVPHVDDKSARAANALVQALKHAPMAVAEQKLDVSGPLEAKEGISPIFGGTFSGHKYQIRPDDAPIKLTIGKLPPPSEIQP